MNWPVRRRSAVSFLGSGWMYNVIIDNKWGILIVFEILAWSATFFLLYARYKMQSSFWFKIASVLVVFTGVIPQVLLGVVNFAATREIDFFTLVIVLLIIYGLTIGKRHVQKLDSWAKKKFRS